MNTSRPQWAGWYLDKDALELKHDTCTAGGWSVDLLRCRTRAALLHQLMAVTGLPIENDALGGLCRALDDGFWPWLNVVEYGRWPWV
jgi:hypothetical protein